MSVPRCTVRDMPSTRGGGDFRRLVEAATGHMPYPYQERIAEQGLPDLLRVPTGTGKTLAATLPWLYRRCFHPDPSVRATTPRWLVLVLPQRSLVEQTAGVVQGWLTNLDSPLQVHVLMGGVSHDDRAWRLRPAHEAVFVGTQDMILSRLLLRGYGEPRSARPISFGLLNSGTQFVFDEVQLMGPALPTSLQLEGLRSALGVALPSRSMWMSATVDPASLATPDYAGVRHVVELSDADRGGGAMRRTLDAKRKIEPGEVSPDNKQYARSVAALVVERHAAGTRTLVVVNTVSRATDIARAIRVGASAADVVLLHSRYRPEDRQRLTSRALQEPGTAGTIVVSTQVLEAGVDTTSKLLVTELAPWSSIVQRAGRCNRAGEYEEASLIWVRPPNVKGAAAPYDEGDLADTAAVLSRLDGSFVTSSQLQETEVHSNSPVWQVLRRRDLRDLFDTSPDLAGNDIDVGRWIRDDDLSTVAVAWRSFGGTPPADAPFPSREELCAAPVGDVREWVAAAKWAAAAKHRSYLYDQIKGEWRRASVADVRPGAVLVLEAADGGYVTDEGWAPGSPAAVPALGSSEVDAPEDFAGDTRSVGSGRWVSVSEHLDDVRRETAAIFAEFGDLPGLSQAAQEAAVLAGAYHDLGKSHPVFAESLRRASRDIEPPVQGGPWAKSPSKTRLRHYPPYFRHELVGALVLLDPAAGILDDVTDGDLVIYLVAAHHGRVRLTVRALPDDAPGRVLGVEEGVSTLALTLADGRSVAPLAVQLDPLKLGYRANGASWTDRVCRLRDRDDLGPFRLGFLEAVVRLADWRASAAAEVRS